MGTVTESDNVALKSKAFFYSNSRFPRCFHPVLIFHSDDICLVCSFLLVRLPDFILPTTCEYYIMPTCCFHVHQIVFLIL